MNEMLESALRYHDEGLCVIPVVPRDKRPAIEWERYQATMSTRDEVVNWFGNGSTYNVGLVHGEVSNNYVTLDIDHEAGLWRLLQEHHPHLLTGRLERSGGNAGYHVPLQLNRLPDFGYNTKQQRPRGNKTWKTDEGHLNIRAQFCQSVAPNSVHPSGGRYVFIQQGVITRIESLDNLISWLNELAPPKKRHKRDGTVRKHNTTGTLLEAVKSAWTTIDVFSHFNLAGDMRKDQNSEIRLCGNGGLLISSDENAWYNFSDEFGGGVIEAWGWCRFGSAYDNRRQFRRVLLEMARDAGIDTARYHRRGDEQITQPQPDGDKHYWGKQINAWGKMR
jgi:hypothetical protein